MFIKPFILIIFIAARTSYCKSIKNEDHKSVGIIGGNDAQIEDYPYVLSLMRKSSAICGATLISTKWVATAAQCTYGTSPSDLAIRGGSRRLFMGEECRVASYTIHPNFNINTLDFDVSVIELRDSFTIENVSPIPIVEDGYVPKSGDIVEVTGWGLEGENGPVPFGLMTVQTVVVDNHVCKTAYDDLFMGDKITDRMFCAGNFDQGGVGPCESDLGGPIVIDGKLAGFVSWSWGCARPKYLGVYSSIGSFRKFINETTGL